MSVTHAPPTHVHRPHVNPWLVAVIALAAALVALGAWVIVDQTRTSTTEGVAPSEVQTMLDDQLVAFNSGDAAALASFYAANAVLEERNLDPAIVTRGSEQIGERIAFFVNTAGMRIESAGPAVVLGDTVARAERFPGETVGYMVVFKLDANGKIAHQWVMPAE
jgi:hypothetical protein